ncbi:MAG: hypothetical protein WCG78_02530, partial [Candidatus Omnitrophota bacterium]
VSAAATDPVMRVMQKRFPALLPASSALISRMNWYRVSGVVTSAAFCLCVLFHLEIFARGVLTFLGLIMAVFGVHQVLRTCARK